MNEKIRLRNVIDLKTNFEKTRIIEYTKNIGGLTKSDDDSSEELDPQELFLTKYKNILLEKLKKFESKKMKIHFENL